MKYTKQLFDETISILVNGYINDTLENGNYCACVVGNILAAKVGAKIVVDERMKIIRDKTGSNTSTLKWEHPEFHGGEWYAATFAEDRKKLLSNTEYSFLDIMNIERAFESESKKHLNHDDKQFNGLMAVVDVLIDIHELGETEKQEAKAMFVKA